MKIILLGAGALWLCGCAAVPVNHIRLIGSRSLDVPGSYSRAVALERGAFVARGDDGSAILIGPWAALLFDYKGRSNRFELLLRKDSQTILYRRLDQRPPMVAGGKRISRPIGIHVDREGDGLDGTFDVVLGRVDLRGFGPAFEHYPRHLRVVGRFVVPRLPEPIGPSTQPAAFWEPPGPARTGATAAGLGDVDDDRLMRTFAADLPALGEASPPADGPSPSGHGCR